MDAESETCVDVEYWTKLDDGRIECGLCPRFCKMRPGQRGLCFVRRAREDGEGMELTGYGRSTGFCVDPIEKKPLNHFLPGSAVLSFGTAGCNLAEPRKRLFAGMDAANVDLKGFTERFYSKRCVGSLEPVLDTLKYLVHETNVWTEITTLLIPGENDSDEELEALTQWAARELRVDVPLHFTAFHPDYRMLETSPTPPPTLQKARAIAIRNGLQHVYVGNVHDPARQATLCPTCGARAIGRDGYTIIGYALDASGACSSCGTRMAGVFVVQPGAWGSRRLSVDIERYAA